MKSKDLNGFRIRIRRVVFRVSCNAVSTAASRAMQRQPRRLVQCNVNREKVLVRKRPPRSIRPEASAPKPRPEVLVRKSPFRSLAPRRLPRGIRPEASVPRHSPKSARPEASSRGICPGAPVPKQLRPSACRQRVLRKTEEAPDLFSRFGFQCRSRGGLRNARQRRRGGLVGAATGGRERSQERFRRSWWAGRAPKRSDRA